MIEENEVLPKINRLIRQSQTATVEIDNQESVLILY